MKQIASNESNKVPIMIDVHHVNNVNEAYMQTLPLTMDKAERVNVIVASGTVLYGVKSLVSTINIITKNRMAWKCLQPRFLQAHRHSGEWKNILETRNSGVLDVLIKIYKRLTPMLQNIVYSFLLQLLFILSTGALTAGQAQSPIGISGKVFSETGEPLIGVTVAEKGTANGSITDVSGSYRLSVNSAGSILIFSFVGYTPEEVEVGNQTAIEVTLIPDLTMLQQIVVVGYGFVDKSDLSGAVASVSSKQVTQVAAVSSLTQSLQGTAPGVAVNQQSGQPGAPVTIRVRGGNSITGGNDPLYVVDGVPVVSIGSELNLNDVQSVEVLKDASATAIYGSRGANGVVMITTKRGDESGKVRVDYDAYMGVQQLRKKLDLLDASTYKSLVNEALTNDGLPAKYTAAEVADNKGTDWQDEVYKPAIVQNHSLSLSGGNKVTRYYTSMNYLNQDGIIKNSGYDRFTFRFNGDQKINDRLTFKNSAIISSSKQKLIQTGLGAADADGNGGIAFSTVALPPTVGIYDADGKYTQFTGVPWGATNPVGLSNEITNSNRQTRIIGNINLDYKLVEGLSFQLNGGADMSFIDAGVFLPSIVSVGQPGGKASKSTTRNSSLLGEGILSYKKEFGKHAIDAIAGYTFQFFSTDNFSASAQNFPSDVLITNSLQSGAKQLPAQSSVIKSNLISYLGRINYSLAGKYILTLTGRYDGSSKFGRNNKYAFFPSSAIAWRISEEDFLEDNAVISDLKIRSSYGTSGNQAISPYQSLSRITVNQPVFGGQSTTGYVLSSAENRDLRWETTTQFDVGVDIGVFQNRLSLSADYYNKKTSDLLFVVQLPSSSGFGTALENVGAITNKGFEFIITSNNLVNEWKWNTSFNMSFNRSTVTDLGISGDGSRILRTDPAIAGGNWFPLILHKAPFQLWGYQVDGIYKTDQEAIQNGEANKHAGDYKYHDENNDGSITEADKKTLTHLQPKFTFGINNEFKYKNFDLSILMVGSYGNDVVWEFNKYLNTMDGNFNVLQSAYNNRWSAENPNGTGPKLSASKSGSIGWALDPNSTWVQDGSYLRFRDIKLGYSVPLKATAKISKLRFYVSTQNMFTITKYQGYDPEAAWNASSVNGWDRGVYPAMKSYTFGLNASF